MNRLSREGPSRVQVVPGGNGAREPSGSRRLAVVGCGHIGLVTAACLAELGHRVTGIDIDEARVEALRAGRVPFIEPGLGDLVAANTALGRLSFTTSYEDGLNKTEFVFLCVNTPATATGAADLRYVRAAVAQIVQALQRSGDYPVIVNRSTSPIGTGDTIEAILARAFAATGRTPRIVANPEFFREGRAVEDFFHPDRIVIGAHTAEHAGQVATLYASIPATVMITDLRTAEMVKYVANTFLATRLSFINEIARLCERLDVDVDEVVRGVALDSRIGGSFFKPGIGYGGSCLPKDVAALCHTGDSVGVNMRVLSAVQDANISQRKHAVNCIRRLLGSLDGRIIATWGATFKGGSEDLRDSPALDVIALLRNEGAWVRVYDPALPADVPTGFADDMSGDAVEAARGADCVAVLTDWPQFAEVDLAQVRSVMTGRLVYDGRNLLRRADVEAAGLLYHGAGRVPTVERTSTTEARVAQ